jgi:MEMO1 family protein
MIVFSAICPHPPIIIPTIGGLKTSKVKKTINAMVSLSFMLKQSRAETIVVVSPHSPVDLHKFNLGQEKELHGSFADFKDFDTHLSFQADFETKKEITKISDVQEVLFNPLDHGQLVPLFFLTREIKKIKLIPMAYAYRSELDNYKFGQKIGNIFENSRKRIAVVASADLSHCLTPDAPAGYSPQGKKFDQLVVKLTQENKVNEILKMDKNLVKKAAECGLRSITLVLGILKSVKYQPKVLSYEGPFGVGYMVANLKIL